MSVNNINPSEFFGGTWEQIKDVFLLACGNVYANGTTGGEATHQLSINEIPSHQHSVLSGAGGNGNYLASSPEYTPSVGNNYYYLKFDGTTNESGGNGAGMANTALIGGNQVHNNMPPYLAIYVWKRTA